MSDTESPSVLCVVAADERRASLVAAFDEGTAVEATASVDAAVAQLETDVGIHCVVLSDDAPDGGLVTAIERFDGLVLDVPVVVVAENRCGVAPAALEAGAVDVVDDDGDVARRLAAERATRAAERWIQETESRAMSKVRRLFENTTDGIVEATLSDETAIIQQANRAFATMVGAEPGTLVGRDLDEVVLPPSRRDEGRTINQRVAGGERVETEVQRLADDEVRTFLLRSVAVTPGSDRAYFVYTDVTERRERERELQRQNERLDEFAGIVSHDLRNPLTVARGHHEVLADECDHASLADLGWALDRMESLIADVLQLARSGKTVDDPRPVSLGQVAGEAWSYCDTADASLTVVEHDGAVLADPERLSALFENLYRNSVAHVGGEVAVTVERTGRGFAVADDGPGLPVTDAGRAFEQGFTTAESGTGFGLAIVEDIAEAHGWTVRVDPAHDGARFVFESAEWVEGDPGPGEPDDRVRDANT
ncbi:sensor histidine kinase [Haloarchaeobius iranensis]|uniref:histidine kinase n=1 Tax=Haloarchaeobius iranensis TaxID=996166 RepID=A0A1G9Y4X7_9EURY|nr:ATP-binding protein [Haloarchaeobius iranensis]SDN04088.1 PAS domain S-box-containing protein [Haloarchaeobius iranensis]